MQVATLLVVAFASLVVAKSDLEVSKEHLAEVKEFAKAPPTFHDVLQKVTHEDKDSKGLEKSKDSKKPEKSKDPKKLEKSEDPKKLEKSGDPKKLDEVLKKLKDSEKSKDLNKKIYFEVIRVNERVVVDEHNVAKGYTANMHNALYSLDSGRLRRLYFTDMVVKPKPGSPLLKSIQIQREKNGEIPGEPVKPPKKGIDFQKLFNKIAKRLRLDQFWPKVFASIVLGFVTTLILYAIALTAYGTFCYITGDSLKKNINRAGTSILQKTGMAERTVFRMKLLTLGGKVETLHREAKAYLDSVRAVALGQERVAAGMASLFDEGSPAARQARMYKDITELLATHGRHDFDEAFRAAVIDPITRYGILFPECEELSKRRTAKLLDYDAARSKVRRATDKPLSDAEKLPRVHISGLSHTIVGV
ncbi:BAR adaptor protein Hob3 [Paramicrosporidium saccamoebae]|uniref:BAR adaptor protein Hob3 n=1 Tax=Paramicrosporidium saccamoebae TaxID=1246581 RepID=A0A2H9TG22_9FUNG|nr:BAR adaptor protein Hob3 [Paramicrosporidium saccamoebae]